MKECYKYTTLTCDECGHNIVYDIFKEEYYCLECGLIRITEANNNENHTYR